MTEAAQRQADKAQLDRLAALLKDAGASAEDLRWLTGIYDQAMALRRMARGT